MQKLTRLSSVLVAVGALSLAATIALWRHASSAHPTEAVAVDAPCTTGEACSAHASSAVDAAARITGQPRLLVFTSGSCSACKKMEPRLDEALKACDGSRDVVRIDLDDDKGEKLAATYEVNLLPSFVSIDAEGNEVARLTGIQPENQLERALEEIRGSRCAVLEQTKVDKAL
jgi:thioredoxin 1